MAARGHNNGHGGQNRGIGGVHRLHGRLGTPLHPRLNGKGIDVDIPDFVDRCKNGNRFNVGADITRPDFYNKEDRAGISLSQVNIYPHKNVGITADIGRAETSKDGYGVKYNACGFSGNVALGPVDIGAKVGTAEAGAKVWEPGVGLDTGFKANASFAEARVAFVTSNVGVGIDTGVKLGKEGVGVEVLGTGVQIGRTTKASLFGSSVSIKWF